jgi:hypothetical protein
MAETSMLVIWDETPSGIVRTSLARRWRQYVAAKPRSPHGITTLRPPSTSMILWHW